MTPRKWGKSNPLSESHRTCLPSNFCLFDVDGFYVDVSKRVIGIYEGKHYMYTEDKGDFIDNFYKPKNTQGGFLRQVSRKVPVWVHEQFSNKWWFVNDGTLEKSNKPNFTLIKTENLIYVEDILNHGVNFHTPVAAFLRTEGKKSDERELDPYIDFIGESLGIKKVLVNDTHEEGAIFFKQGEDLKTKIILDGSDWQSQWKYLEII